MEALDVSGVYGIYYENNIYILPFTHTSTYVHMYTCAHQHDRQPEKAKVTYRSFIQNISSTRMEDIGGIVLVVWITPLNGQT